MLPRNFLEWFIAIMIALGFLAIALGMYDNWERTKAIVEELEADNAQKEIAREMCLIAGYPGFQVVNGNFYCTGQTHAGEIRIKQMIVE